MYWSRRNCCRGDAGQRWGAAEAVKLCPAQYPLFTCQNVDLFKALMHKLRDFSPLVGEVKISLQNLYQFHLRHPSPK